MTTATAAAIGRAGQDNVEQSTAAARKRRPAPR